MHQDSLAVVNAVALSLCTALDGWRPSLGETTTTIRCTTTATKAAITRATSRTTAVTELHLHLQPMASNSSLSTLVRHSTPTTGTTVRASIPEFSNLRVHTSVKVLTPHLRVLLLESKVRWWVRLEWEGFIMWPICKGYHRLRRLGARYVLKELMSRHAVL